MKPVDSDHSSFHKPADLEKIMDEVLTSVRTIIKSNYNTTTDSGRIEKVKDDVLDLFDGNLKDYQECDTHYHNLEHTIQVINPFAQILDGWNKAGQKPWIPFKYFELGLIAVLLHDTGYIKHAGDTEGTGAKYTFVHIERSVAFANQYLPEKRFEPDEVTSICNMILCTGVIDRTDQIAFLSDEETICGYSLATADYISQMSAADYPEKLYDLYGEFKEAYDYAGADNLKKKGTFIFKSAEDLIQRTPLFYTNVVLPRIIKMGSLDMYLKFHHSGKNDSFRTRIEKNLLRLMSQQGKSNQN
ncbi:MAG: hypothetical protein WA610_03465 [Thermodesulfovibrionales bacterium]